MVPNMTEFNAKTGKIGRSKGYIPPLYLQPTPPTTSRWPFSPGLLPLLSFTGPDISLVDSLPLNYLQPHLVSYGGPYLSYQDLQSILLLPPRIFLTFGNLCPLHPQSYRHWMAQRRQTIFYLTIWIGWANI